MYFQSILVNLLVLLLQGQALEALGPSNLAAIGSPKVLAIVAIMSTVGLVTGFFLKHLDSVLKAVASALEAPPGTARCPQRPRRRWSSRCSWASCSSVPRWVSAAYWPPPWWVPGWRSTRDPQGSGPVARRS